MRFITCFLCYLLVACPVLVHANKSKAIRKGQKAPFSGTLLDSEAVARILADKKINKLRCKLDTEAKVAKLEAKSSLKLNSCASSLNAEKSKLQNLLKIKNDEIKRLGKLAYKPKRNLTALWFSIGVIVGAGATIGVAYAIKEVTK